MLNDFTTMIVIVHSFTLIIRRCAFPIEEIIYDKQTMAQQSIFVFAKIIKALHLYARHEMQDGCTKKAKLVREELRVELRLDKEQMSFLSCAHSTL